VRPARLLVVSFALAIRTRSGKITTAALLDVSIPPGNLRKGSCPPLSCLVFQGAHAC